MGRTIFKVQMVGICGTSVLSVQESPPERVTYRSASSLLMPKSSDLMDSSLLST